MLSPTDDLGSAICLATDIAMPRALSSAVEVAETPQLTNMVVSKKAMINRARFSLHVSLMMFAKQSGATNLRFGVGITTCKRHATT